MNNISKEDWTNFLTKFQNENWEVFVFSENVEISDLKEYTLSINMLIDAYWLTESFHTENALNDAFYFVLKNFVKTGRVKIVTENFNFPVKLPSPENSKLHFSERK